MARRCGGRERRLSPLSGSRARGFTSRLMPAGWKVQAGTLSQPFKWRMQRLVLMGFSSYLPTGPPSSAVTERLPSSAFASVCATDQCASTGDSQRNTEIRGLKIAGGKRGIVVQAGNCPFALPAGLSPVSLPLWLQQAHSLCCKCSANFSDTVVISQLI